MIDYFYHLYMNKRLLTGYPKDANLMDIKHEKNRLTVGEIARADDDATNRLADTLPRSGKLIEVSDSCK